MSGIYTKNSPTTVRYIVTSSLKKPSQLTEVMYR